MVGDILRDGGRAVAIRADVSKSADVKRLFSETKVAVGTPSILVNNAGVYRFEPLEEVTAAEFHRQFDTNVLSTILTTRELAIVRAIANGRRNKEIAEQLKIAEGTVKVHLHTIYQKLGVDNRLALMLYARENAIA